MCGFVSAMVFVGLVVLWLTGAVYHCGQGNEYRAVVHSRSAGGFAFIPRHAVFDEDQHDSGIPAGLRTRRRMAGMFPRFQFRARIGGGIGMDDSPTASAYAAVFVVLDRKSTRLNSSHLGISY